MKNAMISALVGVLSMQLTLPDLSVVEYASWFGMVFICTELALSYADYQHAVRHRRRKLRQWQRKQQLLQEMSRMRGVMTEYEQQIRRMSAQLEQTGNRRPMIGIFTERGEKRFLKDA